jgi:UDP-N-acetylmuramate dehydrogenase
MRLADCSYFKTGGTVEHLLQPTNIAELAQARIDIAKDSKPFFFLGRGTNSLIWDDHFPGFVISFNAMDFINKLSATRYEVGAGVSNTEFAEFCFRNSLEGASWMNYLPGEIGATTRMNARCYGGEISEIVQKVYAVTVQGEIKSFASQSVFRGYKDTLFMDEDLCIGSVEVELKSSTDPIKIREHMDFCRNDREKKHQFLHPSCGCVFKNDYTIGIPSGFLLDKAGAKKLYVGSAKINPYHANFIFNTGSASSQDIFDLSVLMRELVFKSFGVWLEYEMEILGNIPEKVKTYIKEQRESLIDVELLASLRREWQNP